MLRLLILAALLAALSAPAARGQVGPFGPLPPAPPEPTAAPERPRDPTTEDDISRSTLLIIGGGLLALFVAIGYVITRDARETLPKSARESERLREEGPHKHAKQAKAKARAKTRAQKRARKAHRKR